MEEKNNVSERAHTVDCRCAVRQLTGCVVPGVGGGLRGARRIFASRNDRRGPGAARWRLLTCPGRRPIQRVQVRRVGAASADGGRIESCAYDGDGAAANTRANGKSVRARAR